MRVPPGGGPAAAVRHGRPQRHRSGRRAGRRGVDGGQQPRQRRPDPDGNVDTEYVNEHPPESLARLTPGRELGWPYCNPDGGPANLPFIRDMSTTKPTAREWTAPRCRRSNRAWAPTRRPWGWRSPRVSCHRHTQRGALMGVHGSWNRRPPRAPEVSFFPWRDGNLGDQQTTGRRLPGRRRLAVGPTRRGSGRTGRRGVYHR